MKKREIAVIGGGPAGLMAALYASRMGAAVTLLERHYNPGGQLVKQTHKFFGSQKQYAATRGIDIPQNLLKEIEQQEVEILLDTNVLGYYPDDGVIGYEKDEKFHTLKPDRLIVATGATENVLPFTNNDLPGIYGAGAVQTLMNEYGIVPGKKALMVGAGNIGLIISYQLMQAGVEVEGIIVRGPIIRGYGVHAAKVRRMGVPINTCCTVKSAHGSTCLEKVTTINLTENRETIPGTEREIHVDLLCIATGLSPLTELLWQAGCQMEYVAELGGHVSLRDKNMRTSQESIFVAGDASGIEEASMAMVEGMLAGLCAAKDLGYDDGRFKELYNDAIMQLSELRSGSDSEKVRKGLKECTLKEVTS